MYLGNVRNEAAAKKIQATAKAQGTSLMGAVVYLVTGKKDETSRGRITKKATTAGKTATKRPAKRRGSNTRAKA